MKNEIIEKESNAMQTAALITVAVLMLFAVGSVSYYGYHYVKDGVHQRELRVKFDADMKVKAEGIKKAEAEAARRKANAKLENTVETKDILEKHLTPGAKVALKLAEQEAEWNKINAKLNAEPKAQLR